MRYRYSAGKNGALEKKAVIYTSDEHGINIADVDNEAIDIVKKLKSAGFDTYIVGGAVRDLILGKKPKDFDIVSAANPSKIKRIFRNSRIIGRRFRLVHIYFGQKIYEAATFRSLKDGITGNTFGTIEEDVLRRDFTMNALFYDPEQQIVIDYVGGMDDIKKKQVKPVIPLADIFTDDPVRMIRAVKYAAAAEFSLPLNLKWQIKKQSNLLTSVSPSRLTEEIFKIIRSCRAAAIVDLLDRMGLYCYLQPQAANLMRKDPSFRQRYLQTMSALDGTEKHPGHALGSLFYDYLESLGGWNAGAAENYKEIFKTARTFVLPMNPPRFEMENALKKFLTSHGITIKRPLIEKRKPETAAAAGNTANSEGETPAVKKRRRRRRKPKSANKDL